MDMGTQMLASKNIPANEADTLGDRLGELVECFDGSAEVHREHKFQRNKGYAFLNFHVLVTRCESVALRKTDRTGDTEGARKLSQDVLDGS